MRIVTKYQIALLLSCTLCSMAHAKDSAIVIFDVSGSMKAKVEGKPKIEIARDVMGTLVKDWNEDIDLGLMVYGHRTKSCDDIEMVLPVTKPDPDKLIKIIKGIVPKGETPIGASIQQAADNLNYIESPTTVILISDGEESCNTDPCTVAKELEKNGVNFTAHVIGFDVSRAKQAKAQEQLKCIAESTGGKFFEAKNAEGLKTALAETAKVVAQPVPKPVEKTEPIKPAAEGEVLWEAHFDGDQLGDAYEVIDPDPDRMIVADGQLTMVASAKGYNHVRIKQTVDGDFSAVVKLSSDVVPFSFAGMNFMANEKSGVGLWFGCFNPGFKVDVVFRKYTNSDQNDGLMRSEIECKNAEVITRYLKIEKKGFSFKAYASIDGSNWEYVGEHTLLAKTGQLELGNGKEPDIEIDGTFNIDDLVVRKLQ